MANIYQNYATLKERNPHIVLKGIDSRDWVALHLI